MKREGVGLARQQGVAWRGVLRQGGEGADVGEVVGRPPWHSLPLHSTLPESPHSLPPPASPLTLSLLFPPATPNPFLPMLSLSASWHHLSATCVCARAGRVHSRPLAPSFHHAGRQTHTHTLVRICRGAFTDSSFRALFSSHLLFVLFGCASCLSFNACLYV